MGTLAVLLNDKSNFVSGTDEDTPGKNDNQEDNYDVCQSFASRLSLSMEIAVHRTTCARPSDYLLPIGTNAPGRLKATRSNHSSVNGLVTPVGTTSPMVMPSNHGLASRMQLLISPKRKRKERMREDVHSQRNLAAVSSASNPSEEFLCDPKSRACQISAIRLARIHSLRDELRMTNEHGIDSFACGEAQQEQSRFSIHLSYQNLSLWSDDEDDSEGSGNHLLETWNRSITARSKRNSINSV